MVELFSHITVVLQTYVHRKTCTFPQGKGRLLFGHSQPDNLNTVAGSGMVREATPATTDVEYPLPRS
jgi:hypothetical protein